MRTNKPKSKKKTEPAKSWRYVTTEMEEHYTALNKKGGELSHDRPREAFTDNNNKNNHLYIETKKEEKK